MLLFMLLFGSIWQSGHGFSARIIAEVTGAANEAASCRFLVFVGLLPGPDWHNRRGWRPAGFCSSSHILHRASPTWIVSKPETITDGEAKTRTCAGRLRMQLPSRQAPPGTNRGMPLTPT